MKLKIPASFAPAVQRLISEGRFQNEDEVIVEGLKLLLKREQFWKELQAGMGQLDAGERVSAEHVYAEARDGVKAIEKSRDMSDQELEQRHQALRPRVREGLTQLERGEYIELENEDSLARYFDRIKQQRLPNE